MGAILLPSEEKLNVDFSICPFSVTFGGILFECYY